MNTRSYRSKIGRLPFAVRNELNERIRDGKSGAEILVWLNCLPAVKKVMRELKTSIVNAQNLTDWRSTGYADWLEDQKDADRIRRLAEVSQTLAAAAGGNVAGVGCSIATAKIMDALESADEEKIADLSTALVKLRASENAAQKVALAEEKNAIQKEQLELSRAKFERDTTRLFKQGRPRARHRQAPRLRREDRAPRAAHVRRPLGKRQVKGRPPCHPQPPPIDLMADL